MNIKTARAMRDLLSILLASIKDKKLEGVIHIKIDRLDNHPFDQYIIIRFIKEL